MSDRPQSFENHARIVPLYHRWATAFLVIPTGWFAYRAATDPSADTVLTAVFAVGVIIAALFARLFPLGVQDRLIRLEEQLRMDRLLPAALRSRAEGLTTRQLIALRFASDDELPGLVEEVLDGAITEPKAIKAAIRRGERRAPSGTECWRCPERGG